MAVCALPDLTVMATGVAPDFAPTSYSIFTARAARSATVAKDIDACTIIRLLAQRDSTGTSVGEKAVLVLKVRNR